MAPRHGGWVARIRVRYVLTVLGYFATEEEAAEACDRAAVKAWGLQAKLNFHPSGTAGVPRARSVSLAYRRQDAVIARLSCAHTSKCTNQKLLLGRRPVGGVCAGRVGRTR